MRGTWRSLVATLLVTGVAAGGIVSGGGIASAVDDEYLGLLLETRRHLNEAIDEVLTERDAINGRIASEDWLVFPTGTGVVEVDLRDLDGYVPLAQQLLAGDPELKATVIGTLKEASPEAWEALTLLDFVGRLASPGSTTSSAPSWRWSGTSLVSWPSCETKRPHHQRHPPDRVPDRLPFPRPSRASSHRSNPPQRFCPPHSPAVTAGSPTVMWTSATGRPKSACCASRRLSRRVARRACSQQALTGLRVRHGHGRVTSM